MTTSRAVVLAASLAAVAVGTVLMVGRADADGIRTVSMTAHYSKFSPARVEVRPGETVRFVVRNTDPIDHELIIGDRAVQDRHERGTEPRHGARPGEVTVPAGETRSTTYTFGTDDVLFGCHSPGHYAYGMKGVISVSR